MERGVVFNPDPVWRCVAFAGSGSRILADERFSQAVVPTNVARKKTMGQTLAQHSSEIFGSWRMLFFLRNIRLLFQA